MSKLAISLALAMAQVVLQVGLILGLPAYYSGSPAWTFSIMPLVVFGGSLVLQVVMGKRKQEIQKLR